MASMYAKLMSRITESSLMDEDLPVRYCFMMLLAIADPKGYVIGTDIAIARRMNVDVELWRRCRDELMKPDPDSNSKEHEGRRIIESDCERGYFVVNYVKYRDTRDEEDRRNYMREYMRKYREEKYVANVNYRKPSKPRLAKAEGEEEVEEKEEKKPKGPASEEWLSDLRKNSSYSHIDIDRELGKMKAWLALPKNKGRKFSPQFILNWLNKIEAPLPLLSGTTATISIHGTPCREV